MADEISKIENIIEEKTVEGIKNAEEERKEFFSLQRKAKKFLNQIQFLKNWGWKNQSIRDCINTLYSNIDNTDFIRKCFVAVQDFEYSINNFLDRQIFLTFVNSQGKILFIGHNQAKKIYSEVYASGSKNGKATYSDVPGANQQITNFHNDLLNTMKKKVDSATRQKAYVYQLALQRYDTNMNYKRKFPNLADTFYYRSDKWPYIKYRGLHNQKTASGYKKGHISQAYADAIINNRNNFYLESKQHSLQILSNLIDIDKIPAIIKGDVKLDINGNFQFAVKGTDASSAAIGPYVAFAYYLLLLKQPITKNELNNKIQILLKNKRQVANTILADLLGVAASTLKKHLPEYQQTILNILK